MVIQTSTEANLQMTRKLITLVSIWQEGTLQSSHDHFIMVKSFDKWSLVHLKIGYCKIIYECKINLALCSYQSQ